MSSNGYNHDAEWQPEKKASVGSRRRSTMKGKPEGYEDADPFGGEEEGEVKYRTLTWVQTAFIMVAETISLGILSLPSVLASVGVAPGIILIIGLGIIATYTAYVIGQFKMAYPYVQSMYEAGEVLFSPIGMGRIGAEFFGAAQCIFLIFSMASHILIWTIMLQTVTDSGTCTIVWSIVGLVLFWILDLPRTLKKVSWLSIASCISILAAVLITIIALGVKGKVAPLSRPATIPGQFQAAFINVGDIVFAYAGHVAFFSFISEMKRPQEWAKAVYTLQAADVSMYIIAAITIYWYAGEEVASPAFGSVGGVVEKVAWGISIPTILIAGVIYGHVVTKYVYIRIFRNTRHMYETTFLSVGTWAAIALAAWTIAWIIAESIPVFNDLLSLISSLFAAHFTYGLSGVFWLFLNWGQLFKNWKKGCLTVINVLIVILGWAICGIGLYASGYTINQDSKSAGGSWTCAPRDD